MKIILVGGSNCIIRGGFGEELVKALDGHDVVNHSLGASCVLRAAQILCSDTFRLADWDRVVIEYTINDYIFEQSNVIDPLAHAQWVAELAAAHASTRNLFLAVLPNYNSLSRALDQRSFVY